MRWTVHGERELYDSEWMRLVLVDVEVPDGPRFDHHVVRFPNKAAGTVVRDPQRGVLLLWRHRFITDTWGWELPAGRIDPGETPEEAAERETLEETGWRAGPLTPLGSYAPNNGSSDQLFHVFLADGATYVSDPLDPSESERVEWRSVEQVRRAIRDGEVTDGLSLTGLLWALAFERL
ncbi:MAG TPA: NUDIX hydrolase [Acidimicrobiales bacterium]|jgi:8-oxo-dGTP pyrophosphatase MutT (NUDIX family)|nr:NUDIX hydrolase [Acidimicrobiales bacterium]